jgi:hypothetical protein
MGAWIHAAAFAFLLGCTQSRANENSSARVDLPELRRTLVAAYRRAATRGSREELLARLRAALLGAIAEELFPAWYGTPWSYSGTTRVPRRGAIACGYFVSTILEQAGFRLERARLAQQPAERILQTLVPDKRLSRFRDRPLQEVLTRVREEGEGLYLIGLDQHVGFILHRGERLDFCHASYLGRAEVLCEPAISSPALASRYRVLGKLFAEPMLRHWLAEERIVTRTR